MSDRHRKKAGNGLSAGRGRGRQATAPPVTAPPLGSLVLSIASCDFPGEVPHTFRWLPRGVCLCASISSCFLGELIRHVRSSCFGELADFRAGFAHLPAPAPQEAALHPELHPPEPVPVLHPAGRLGAGQGRRAVLQLGHSALPGPAVLLGKAVRACACACAPGQPLHAPQPRSSAPRTAGDPALAPELLSCHPDRAAAPA